VIVVILVIIRFQPWVVRTENRQASQRVIKAEVAQVICEAASHRKQYQHEYGYLQKSYGCMHGNPQPRLPAWQKSRITSVQPGGYWTGTQVPWTFRPLIAQGLAKHGYEIYYK
jgi:hypothetical protein